MGRKSLYRIVHIATLIKMFKEKKNYLSSPSSWPDYWEKLEIRLSKEDESKRFNKFRDITYAQCWSNEAYSWALWKMNSTDSLGVRIKTNISELYKDLPQTFRNKYAEEVAIREVEYLSEEAIKKRIKEMVDEDGMTYKTVRSMYYLKRRAFEYEKEVRLIVPRFAWMSGFHEEEFGSKRFLSYKSDPCDYIESIYFDSKVDSYLYDIFSEILKDFKFEGLIDKSTIDRKPETIKIG